MVVASILPAPAPARPAAVVKLEVPVVVRPNGYTGPASLAMVMGFYGADSVRRRRADEAFDVKSKSASVQDLAATARRLGYAARVAEPGIDSLASFLRAGVPPILCVEPREGVPGKSRYFVVTRWETLGTRFFVLDGSPRPRSIGWSVLQSVWQPGGGRALIVTPRH
jgi:ABC-type bacteriocin/lantibiotic exporter with double-glycine peptidase domain